MFPYLSPILGTLYETSYSRSKRAYAAEQRIRRFIAVLKRSASAYFACICIWNSRRRTYKLDVCRGVMSECRRHDSQEFPSFSYDIFTVVSESWTATSRRRKAWIFACRRDVRRKVSAKFLMNLSDSPASPGGDRGGKFSRRTQSWNARFTASGKATRGRRCFIARLYRRPLY